jgi:antitoxin HicB
MADFHYTVVLEPGDPDEGGYVVSVPAFPEAHTEGDTVEEALANAREAISLCLEVREERGDPIPASDAQVSDVRAVRVTFPS